LTIRPHYLGHKGTLTLHINGEGQEAGLIHHHRLDANELASELEGVTH
jgi:hypothetical protein